MAFLWVGGACAGWLPGAWAVAAQAWWWLVTSVVVLGVCAVVPPHLTLRHAGWSIGLLSLGVVGWVWRMPATIVWLIQPLLWLLAGVGVVERWGWHPVRQAVVVWAWVQVGCLPLAWLGLSLYDNGWTGTIGQRSILAAWLGVASLWSSRWRAWSLAILSLATGSVTGVPSLLRLVTIRWIAPMTWVGVMGVGLVSWRWWVDRLTLRWDIWTQAVALVPTHWMTGWGLQQLPIGFREFVEGAKGTAHRWAPTLDLHNTWLDVLVRGGSVGFILLLVVMCWALWRSLHTQTAWTWWFAAWTMSWQSVGANPALMCVAIIWLLSLCEPRRVDVHSV